MTKKKSLSVELLVQIWWKVVGDRRNEIDKILINGQQSQLISLSALGYVKFS